MIVKWGSSGVLAVCLALSVGCKTPPPVLKPDPVPEKLVAPPEDARYASPDLPALAFDKQVDPAKALMDAKNNPSAGAMRQTGMTGGPAGR